MAAISLSRGLFAAPDDRSDGRYTTRLFNKTCSLDTKKGLDAYVRLLDAQITRSKKEELAGEAHKKDPLHHREPRNYIDKKLRKAMEEARKTAKELRDHGFADRSALLDDLAIMADGIQGSFARVLPPNMDALTAYRLQNRLRHPRVGLGDAGRSVLAAHGPVQAGFREHASRSTFWHDPGDISNKDLYVAFGRESLPELSGIICTYQRSKQSKGVHGGLDVKCGDMGKAKLKFGEEYSQPFAHRILWALGYNTPPVDCVPEVKVKWDKRIFTEFNTRKDESFTVSLLGVPLHHEKLQHYLDPLAPVREIVILDEKGASTTLRPNPTWDSFKKLLYRDPRGHPETVPGNFNDSFADRIQFLVYRHVNLRLEDDESEEDRRYMGSWDWNNPIYAEQREDRGFVFLSAWINQFDTWVHNNKLYVSGNKGDRRFERYVTDLGGCLGPAVDSGKMVPQDPNGFPWSFTLPAIQYERRIPLDGSFHNIRENRTVLNADIDDAKWAASLMERLTRKQIMEALIASRMPSAEARLFFNKLVHRRNKALKDLGLSYTPIRQLDERVDFNYDPRTDGLMSVRTKNNENMTAPDDGSIVVKGRMVSRQQKVDLKKETRL